MGKLAQRFLDPARSGVYRVADGAVPRMAAAEAGLALFEIAAADPPEKAAVLRQFAASLAFPGWFGGNWDALEDCLSDLSWHAAAGHVLLIHGADAFRARHPDDFGVLVDVLGACADYWRERGVPFFAVCADPRAALALPALYSEPR